MFATQMTTEASASTLLVVLTVRKGNDFVLIRAFQAAGGLFGNRSDHQACHLLPEVSEEKESLIGMKDE